MSDRENPLTRWSRRKREAAVVNKQANATQDEVASPRTTEGQAPGEARSGAEQIEPTFDPESLPPLDSISAETDIRAFLAPGVPPELTREALRRAWRADPRIRDFVGLADYDWDFNAPGSMPGFGPLDLAEELRKQLVQAIGGAGEPAQSSSRQEIALQPESVRGQDEIKPPPQTERADHQDQAPDASAPITPPKQGGALPK